VRSQKKQKPCSKRILGCPTELCSPADTTIPLGHMHRSQTGRFVDLNSRGFRRIQACLDGLSLFGLPCALVEVDEATECILCIWMVYPQCLLIPSQCSLRPLYRFLNLPLLIEYYCHILDACGWSTPKAFSIPANARLYHSSAFSYCPWLSNKNAMLLTVVRVSGWSTPNAFSFPANTR